MQVGPDEPCVLNAFLELHLATSSQVQGHVFQIVALFVSEIGLAGGNQVLQLVPQHCHNLLILLVLRAPAMSSIDKLPPLLPCLVVLLEFVVPE
jgi:hypothetical protein